MFLVNKYFEEFGKPQMKMAASVSALKSCKQIIDSHNAQSILDLGSGLSSVFFHSQFDNVTTADDNEFWAARTKQFITTWLKKDIRIGTIESLPEKKFDFVFYDYGSMEARIYYFARAFEMCEKIFFMDDVHVNYYREYIQTKYKEYTIYFLPETIDEYGRYTGVILKEGVNKSTLSSLVE